MLQLLTPHGRAFELNKYLERELGINPEVYQDHHWVDFFKSCEVRDLLDTITLAAKFLGDGTSADGLWRDQARRILAEEHLAYEIDDEGVVHPAIDQEFQKNRAATIAGLQLPRYANSLAAFARVSDELVSTPPNGKEAWRAMFAAVEGLFRLMFSSAPQLNSGTVESNLTPVVQRIYASDPIALRAAMKQLASFKDWVDASHNYRHEQGSEEPVQPPLDLVVLAVSNGAAYIRWLIALDEASAA